MVNILGVKADHGCIFHLIADHMTKLLNITHSDMVSIFDWLHTNHYKSVTAWIWSGKHFFVGGGSLHRICQRRRPICLLLIMEVARYLNVIQLCLRIIIK